MLYPFYIAGFFIAKLLPLRLSYFLASCVSRACYFLSRSKKNALRKNLKVVLGPGAPKKEIDRYAVSVFTNFGKYLVDFLRFSKFSGDYISKNVKIEGIHHIDECLAGGKGALIISAHMGNWELGGAIVAAQGYSLNAIVLEHRDKRVNDFFIRQRAINGLKAIHIGIRLKQCFRVLKDNELLAIVIDKDYTDSSTSVRFFGKEARMPKGAAVFALRTGAPIIVCILTREKDDTFKLRFEEPIRYEPTGDAEKDIKILMEKYLAVFEKYIKEYADQWYVFQKIWD